MPNFDLIGAIELTASAAILIGGFALAQPEQAGLRRRTVALLGAWFALAVAGGALGIFDPYRGLGTPVQGIAVLAPVLLLAYAGLYSRSVHAALMSAPISLVIGLHVVRVLGLSFVLLYANHRLPAPFAPIAGWGDIFAGLTALPVAWAVQRQKPGWRPIALLWNSLGMLDLVAAIGLGVTSAEGSPIRLFFTEPSTILMTGLPWVLVPAFLVPLLMATHLAVFYRLAPAMGRCAAAGA